MSPGGSVLVSPDSLLGSIFVDGPDGTLRTSSQKELAEAIREAVRAGANIINISGGQPEPSGEADPDLVKAVEECTEKGVLVVAAAGNGGCPGLGDCECVHVPGAIPSVLAVGAMGDNDQPRDFSNCGPQYLTQGILALGENIEGAIPGGKTEVSTGTSFATPIVAGIASLLMSVQRKRGQPVDALFVRNALLDSAKRCEETKDPECQRLLVGRLDVSRAMQFLLEGDQAMSTESSSKAVSQPVRDAEASGERKLSPSIPVHPGDTNKEFHQVDNASNGGVATGRNSIPDVRRLVPSACYTQQPGQFVYVIGNLGFDFGTHSNRGSILANAGNGEIKIPGKQQPITAINLDSPFGILAYLLGYRVRAKPGASGVEDFKPIELCGNLNDAKYINWTILHDDCPKYAVKPQGEFAEAAYLEILRFLIEQEGITCISVGSKPQAHWADLNGQFEIQLRGDCLRELFSCHGNETCPERAFSGDQSTSGAGGDASSATITIADLLGETASTAAHVAIGGEVCGPVTLFTGEVVETINPAMRTTATWNTARILKSIPSEKDQAALLVKVAAALYDRVRNDGRSPEDRAINFTATAFIANFPELITNNTFTTIAGEIKNLAFDDITVTKSDCQRWDTLRYDVELSLYDFENQFRGRTIVRNVVDVSQVNPFLDAKFTRLLTKR